MPQKKFTQAEFGRTLWRAVASPLMLLAGHAILLSILFFYWLSASDLSREGERSIAKIYDVERLLVNMETGYRGWLLTGDRDFLDPYLASRESVPKALAQLHALIGETAGQADRISELNSAFLRWEALRPFPAPTTQGLNARKSEMDVMRRILREMMLTESKHKSERYDLERRAAMVAAGGGIGVSLLLAFALALINRRTVIDLSQAYQGALEDETASNKQFVDLAEAVPQLIWITDGDGKATFFNRPWSEFAGAAMEEMTSKGWESWLHPEDQPSAIKRWNHSRTTGEAFESEYRLRRGSDGSYRWFLCRAVGVRGKDGKNVRWFGSCTDIENQKRSQQERESLLAAERRARSDLIRASRVKDEFLATLSHELRTPMTAILGWARLLRDPKMREKNLERGIEAIDASAKAQARLIEDLLDMNRILTGKLALQPELVDFRAIVRQAVTAVQPAASNKQISLTTELDDTEAAFIEADPARLQQVVWNILTNAVKFTPVGGTVEVRLQSEGGFLRLTVKDSGRGIKQSFLPHVFERFRQADGSTTREFGGLGLGLAIVRSLVEMHGGTVAADSPGEGLGATFTVELPLRTESTSEVTSEKPRGSMVDRAIIKGKRVLAVDDDFAAGSIIRTILESGGAEVQVVLSAAEALALLRQQEFDLLLSDIGMPEMDGYGLRREVSKLEEAAGRKIPTMALTAFARAEDRAQALAAGFDAHLAKPIYPNELLAAVAKLLESR